MTHGIVTGGGMEGDPLRGAGKDGLKGELRLPFHQDTGTLAHPGIGGRMDPGKWNGAFGIGRRELPGGVRARPEIGGRYSF